MSLRLVLNWIQGMTSSTKYSKKDQRLQRPLTELSLYHVWEGNVLLPSTNKLVPFDKISYKLDVIIQIQLGNLVTYKMQCRRQRKLGEYYVGFAMGTPGSSPDFHSSFPEEQKYGFLKNPHPHPMFPEVLRNKIKLILRWNRAFLCTQNTIWM